MKTIHLTDEQATELAYALAERVALLQSCTDSPARQKRTEATQSVLQQVTDEKSWHYITYSLYGSNINLLYRAAREHGALLLSVKGYALDRYPGPRDYVEGQAGYIFLVDATSPRAGWNFVIEKIYPRYCELLI